MSSVWDRLARALSPVEDRPRLAPGLESARYTTRSGGEYVVVSNPARRAYARLDPREFDLLALMDGQHSVKELVISYYQRHGVLALSRVAGLVGLLREQHFLGAQQPNAYARLAALLRGSLRPALGLGDIGVHFAAFDRALGDAYRAWGHLFFNKVWLAVGIGLGVLGPLLVVLELFRGRYVLYDLGGSAVSTIALLLLLTVIALAVHELGHGLAVKHAGRRVHQAGVRLYYGLPAAYVDTTDIWMAPPRQRMLTAFAGPWTGLVLGGVCAIGAAAAPTGAIGGFLFTAAFVFFVDNLFNFNPLLELDGYYVLIDFLDRPLLRPQALAFVRGPLWLRLWRREPLSSEERLLTWFGLLAMTYGIAALVVAMRAWQALLLPMVVSSWESGELARQLVAAVLVSVIVVPVLITVLLFSRRLLAPAGEWLAWIGHRAVQHLNREALETLRSVPMWSELPTARLLEVARAMRAQDVDGGVEVVRQGEEADQFYLIARGAFEVVVDGQPQLHLRRGDYFGERALLHREPRSATVVAIEPGRVYALESAAFDRLLASDLAARSRLEAALAYREEVADMLLFRDLSSGELDVLLMKFAPQSVEAGEVVIRQGDSGERFYVVRSGRVQVTRNGEVLAELGPGEAFGEIALLLDVPRTATVTALESTRLLVLEAQDFRDLLAGYLGRAGELERLSHLRLRAHKRLDEVV